MPHDYTFNQQPSAGHLGYMEASPLAGTAQGESQLLVRAQEMLQAYMDKYDSYAAGVLQQIARTTPDWLSAYQSLYAYAMAELAALRRGIQIRRVADLTAFAGILDATVAFMNAAELLEDQAGMLGHAPDYLQAALTRLRLLDSVAAPAPAPSHPLNPESDKD